MPSHAQQGIAATVVVLGFCLAARDAAANSDTPDAAGLEFFEKKVRPILAEHCFGCHSTRAKKLRGGLHLDSRNGLLSGGDNGPVLIPGQPEKSRLIEAIRYGNVDLRMPPRGKLPDAAINDLVAWVRMGAPWPAGAAPRPTGKEQFDLQKRKREHWAWQPVRSLTPPLVRDSAWPRSPIDRFLLAKMEEKGLSPAPAAGGRTLLRRAWFDLVGLPPPAEAVEAFVRDESPDAFEKVVDRLLASPHFGELWGRHWLDLVRYGETRGHEFDPNIPNAYQYRDYVIRAFNDGVPYNQFVVEHLAGDLLEKPRLHPTQGFNESILGTGFWFLGEEVHSPVDIRQDQADRFDNRLDVMTKTFLGLTVACARCHDHKFDAISTRDYYALFGFLASSSYRQARFDSMEHNRRVAAELWRLRERARAPLQRALAESLRPAAEHFADYLLFAQEAIQLRNIPWSEGLDPNLTQRWLDHLLAAAKDETDPLHAWAIATLSRDSKPTAATLAARWRKRHARADPALEGAEVVIDYRKPSPDWMPDGVIFGPGPVRPGEVRLDSEGQHPILTICEGGAAAKDPTWDVLKPARGAETDPGALGTLVSAGRTLRTPNFTITRGKVFYRVRGRGRAYAAVSQHVMINGPLHGELILPLEAGQRFHWIVHDLSRYKGLPVHVEFTPADGSDFAIALVVQADFVPDPLDRPIGALLRLLAGDGARPPKAIAAGYQRLFLDTLKRLASDRLIGDADHARLASWLLRKRELFGDVRTIDRRLADVAAPFLAEQARLLAKIKPESRLAPAMLDGSAHDEHVFIRGVPRAAGPLVPRRFLEALAGVEGVSARGSGRLELARQMTDPVRNPFVARVIVNRIWHHLFGRGLVGSVDNFGVLGEAPTHPELLDYLAAQFVREGWSIKKLIRELVLSSAYRMSSHPGGKAEQIDPQNLLLHRMRVRRLEGEAIRDSILAISGRLDSRLYGRSVPVQLTPFQDGRGKPASGPLDGDGRRSVYLAVRRNFLSSFLLAFDTPIPFSTVGRRTVSNVPAQALILMNDPFVHQQAEQWANRILAEGGTTRERITSMYRSAFGRPPLDTEVRSCLRFLVRQTGVAGSLDDLAVWADLAHVLFNVKEFIFLE
jgi:hypothetical protein